MRLRFRNLCDRLGEDICERSMSIPLYSETVPLTFLVEVGPL